MTGKGFQQTRRFYLGAGLAMLVSGAHSQAGFPSKPLRMIVPVGAGSASDTFARLMSDPMGRLLGQPVVVENKVGADGIIGTVEVVRAPADGHTLLLGGNGPIAFNPAARSDLPYKIQDLRAVHGLLRGAAVLVVPAGSTLRSFADVVAEAQKGPEKVTMANYAPGLQMAAAWLASTLKTTFVHVPYKGAAALLTDIVGGQIPLAIADVSAVIAHVNSGKLRALAVTGSERVPALPAVPTIKEAGFEEFAHYSWTGIFVRSETPDAIVRRLESVLARVTSTPEFEAKVRESSTLPMRFSADQMADWVSAETARHQRLLASFGMQQQR